MMPQRTPEQQRQHDFDTENLRLMNSPDELMRAHGRLRARIGQSVMQHDALERQLGRTVNDVLADLLRYAAMEYGSAFGRVGLDRGAAQEHASAAAQLFIESLMSGYTLAAAARERAQPKTRPPAFSESGKPAAPPKKSRGRK